MKQPAVHARAQDRTGRMMWVTRMAAIGGIIASVGIVIFFAFVVYITLPGAYSGLDTIEAVVTWISIGLIAVLAIGVNVVYARVLFAMARFPHGFPISGKFPRS